ncbi:hypothetical protein C1645_881323 [Glomus cerebriforme]|uniref:Uncharacterized protein n=1 Tax=Glomus cerebriforme TaxID=658196 RepID=A0A397S6E3_9GLOM|nr:hypothetical protein C1645_881323 [Glomus cerebriforme]
MSRTRESRFTEETDNKIIELIKKYGRLPNCYVKISKKMNKQYTPKQIRNRYINKLNPNLCHEPLSKDEKLFIIKWDEENPSSDGIFHLKFLIPALEHKFKKLRSENDLKNFWYPRKRAQNTKAGNKQQTTPLPLLKDEIPSNTSQLETSCLDIDQLTSETVKEHQHPLILPRLVLVKDHLSLERTQINNELPRPLYNDDSKYQQYHHNRLPTLEPVPKLEIPYWL